MTFPVHVLCASIAQSVRNIRQLGCSERSCVIAHISTVTADAHASAAVTNQGSDELAQPTARTSVPAGSICHSNFLLKAKCPSVAPDKDLETLFLECSTSKIK